MDLHRVQEILAGMLDDLESSEAQEAFAFVDSLELLRKNQNVVKHLESLVASQLLQLSSAGSLQDVSDLDVHVLEFAPPDGIRLEEVESFRVMNGAKEASFEEPNLGALRVALHAAEVRRGMSFMKSVKVLAVGADGGELSQAIPLLGWLVFEAGRTTARYVLTLGRWFSLKESYAAKLDADLQKIEDVTAILGLSNWTKGTDERQYNIAAAGVDAALLSLDRVLVETEDGARIESCDLLHQAGFLIHVKRYNGSQTLSHLFSQGAVSAELLNGDGVFKNNFVAAVVARDADFEVVATDAPVNVTYAIGVEDDRNIPLGLPTFSKVNLRDEARRLRNARVKPTVARIVIE